MNPERANRAKRKIKKQATAILQSRNQHQELMQVSSQIRIVRLLLLLVRNKFASVSVSSVFFPFPPPLSTFALEKFLSLSCHPPYLPQDVDAAFIRAADTAYIHPGRCGIVSSSSSSSSSSSPLVYSYPSSSLIKSVTKSTLDGALNVGSVRSAACSSQLPCPNESGSRTASPKARMSSTRSPKSGGTPKTLPKNKKLINQEADVLEKATESVCKTTSSSSGNPRKGKSIPGKSAVSKSAESEPAKDTTKSSAPVKSQKRNKSNITSRSKKPLTAKPPPNDKKSKAGVKRKRSSSNHNLLNATKKKRKNDKLKN